MKIYRAVVSFFMVTLIYLIVLLWAESKNQLFNGLSGLLPALLLISAASLMGYLIRYVRWHWLLARAQYSIRPLDGFMAYLSGFAFTATPGKVGELVRIKYLTPLGVRPELTLSAFIYERAFDLLVVLVLASLAIHRIEIFILVAGFVACILVILIVLIFNVGFVKHLSSKLASLSLMRLSRLVWVIREGLLGCRLWFTALDLGISFFLGALAWGMTALSFVYLCQYVGIELSALEGISIYPTSMLAGAASMIPGGLGSTEGVIIAMLVTDSDSANFAVATLAAIGIRFATLWLSIFCGLLSIIVLEIRKYYE